MIKIAELFFSTTQLKSDFELIDLITVFDSFFNRDLKFKLFHYEYNGVNGSWESINPSIINFLKEEQSKPLIISYSDFLVFSRFIGQTESGCFQILSSSNDIYIKVEVFDAYFWRIFSDNVEILKKIMNHKKIINFLPELVMLQNS